MQNTMQTRYGVLKYAKMTIERSDRQVCGGAAILHIPSGSLAYRGHGNIDTNIYALPKHVSTYVVTMQDEIIILMESMNTNLLYPGPIH